MNQRQSVYSLWIINKSGGLVYDKVWLLIFHHSFFLCCVFELAFALHRHASTQTPAQNFLDSKALEVNALLKISGLFHGMHAISKQLAGSLPGDAERGGIECIEADGFRFQCFESMSGIKFLCSTDPHFARASDVCLRVYKPLVHHAHTPPPPLFPPSHSFSSACTASTPTTC